VDGIFIYPCTRNGNVWLFFVEQNNLQVSETREKENRSMAPPYSPLSDIFDLLFVVGGTLFSKEASKKLISFGISNEDEQRDL